jgi:hypothetical protein
MIHRGVEGPPAERTVRVYQLEFVDRGFYDEWITSETILPVGMAYRGSTTKGLSGSGYVWDEPSGANHKTIANVVVFYVDEERQTHVTKLRIDQDHRVLQWLLELSLQPKDFEGPGRPPKRYLEMSNYTQRGRRR